MAMGTTVPVDPTNADALRSWDGDEGAYWAAHERAFDASVARYQAPFLAAAAIGPDDVVLDVGCGTGATTRDAARRATAGSALGVDLSSRMVALARRRAADEGVGNARFLQADAQAHPFDPGAFTVAVSRTGAMFFGDPVAAFRNVARALRPAGRLALLVWQGPERNPWFGDFAAALSGYRDVPAPPPDAPGPFSWGDPDRATRTLTAAGFADVRSTGVEAPMHFGDTVDEAHAFVRGLGLGRSLLATHHDDAARARALDALRDTLTAHVTPDGVAYPSATWVVTARRAPG